MDPQNSPFLKRMAEITKARKNMIKKIIKTKKLVKHLLHNKTN